MQSGSGALQSAWCPAAGANCTCVGVWVPCASRGCVSLSWLPALHHHTSSASRWAARPGGLGASSSSLSGSIWWRAGGARAWATSLNACTTTMEQHGSPRPGFVGVHIGAGQHSEVSNILLVDASNRQNFSHRLKPIFPFLPLSPVGCAVLCFASRPLGQN